MDKYEVKRLELYNRALSIKENLPKERKIIYENFMTKHSSFDFKNFTSLGSAYRFNKLPLNIHSSLKPAMERLENLKKEEMTCREESFKLLEIIQAKDTRKILNPKLDGVPANDYPKLKNCNEYPLRKSCNHGENKVSKWERCEYMKYDNSKSIFNDERWICIAKDSMI